MMNNAENINHRLVWAWPSRTTKVRLVMGVCVSRVQIPNGISIGSAAVAGLMLVANRQTDRETDRQRDTGRQGRFAIGRLGLVVANLCTKFKVSHFITKADKHTGVARGVRTAPGGTC